MSYTNWLEYLRSAEKTSIATGRSRRVFYKFPDGKQMAEEYNLDTGVATSRYWRESKTLFGEPDWECEMGDRPPSLENSAQTNPDAVSGMATNLIFKESVDTPILTKRLTRKNIQWRIRNLTYPLNVYNVRADAEKNAIVVSTTNKKYYKIIKVPELIRCQLKPQQENISVHHQYNTLIITYEKPSLVIEMETNVLLLLKDVTTETDIEELLQNLMVT